MTDSTTTECLLFPEIFAKPAVLQFDQRQSSSDGGARPVALLSTSIRPTIQLMAHSRCPSSTRTTTRGTSLRQ